MILQTWPTHPMLPPPEAAETTPAERARVEEVRDRLRRSGYLELREISVEALGSRVVLRGRVSSFYLKQVAQGRAGEVEGVRLVVNRIEVQASARHRGRRERPLTTPRDH